MMPIEFEDRTLPQLNADPLEEQQVKAAIAVMIGRLGMGTADVRWIEAEDGKSAEAIIVDVHNDEIISIAQGADIPEAILAACGRAVIVAMMEEYQSALEVLNCTPANTNYDDTGAEEEDVN